MLSQNILGRNQVLIIPFPLKSTTTRPKLRNCFQMATKSQQQFLRKLKQLTKSRVDRDCETLNGRDRLTASVERLWPQKKSEEYIGTSNTEEVQQGLDQLRRLVGSCTNLASGRDGCELRGCEEQIDGKGAGASVVISGFWSGKEKP